MMIRLMNPFNEHIFNILIHIPFEWQGLLLGTTYNFHAFLRWKIQKSLARKTN